MHSNRMLLGWGVALTSIVATLVVAGTGASLPRILSTLVIVAGPGLAWVPLLGLRDKALALLLCLLVSVAAVIVVAQVVTYVAAFSWRPCEFALLGMTLCGLWLQSWPAMIHGLREGD
jgi:hypothetical protein